MLGGGGMHRAADVPANTPARSRLSSSQPTATNFRNTKNSKLPLRGQFLCLKPNFCGVFEVVSILLFSVCWGAFMDV
jgi:hypothetical protein